MQPRLSAPRGGESVAIAPLIHTYTFEIVYLLNSIRPATPAIGKVMSQIINRWCSSTPAARTRRSERLSRMVVEQGAPAHELERIRAAGVEVVEVGVDE